MKKLAQSLGIYLPRVSPIISVVIIITFSTWIISRSDQFILPLPSHNWKFTGSEKKSPTPLLGQVVTEQKKDDELKQTDGSSSHEEGEFSPKNDDTLNTGHEKEFKANEAAKHVDQSDHFNRSRSSLFNTFCSYICTSSWFTYHFYFRPIIASLFHA